MIILDRIHRETGREFALRTLKENIVHLELKPGAKVSENELASAMGLSRTPVREALIELSKVNIVEIYPQRGSAIALIDHSLVEESQFMRQVLECGAVKLCCETATDEEIIKLRERVRLQEFYLDSPDSSMKLLLMDNLFHKTIFDIAKKPQVFIMMRNLAIHLDRMRTLTLQDIPYAQVVEYHRGIVDAIAKRDATTACKIMEEHICNFRTVESEVVNRFPAYFKS